MVEVTGVGLIGLGTVGTGVVRLLRQRAESRRPTDVAFDIRCAAVRDLAKTRQVDLDKGLLTTDPESVICDPSVDLVVELSGDAEARSWIARALDQGKDTVTANKAVLAEFGEELFDRAQASGADLMFEASVAGGIPIIRSLRSGLAANRVESIYGILNGTTNYILSQMTRGTGDYAESLELAQRNGFAESDPTMDLNGLDAAQKLAILCRIAFGTNASGSELARSGIEGISRADIDYARELG
jgi:homoserine dehydrogenase